MPRTRIVRSSPVIKTARVLQMEGMFDVPPSECSEESWEIDFELPEQWNVGLIVGPSGSGKTTVARELFGDSVAPVWNWDERKSVLDGFPIGMGIKEIIELLSSVGFSSPPSWVRPFHVLSNGEQFRVSIARTIAEMRDIALVDEFTSVVDRTVAQIGSRAIANTVRKRNQRFIAVSCHYDILEWLEPDWIYQPHINELARGSLQRPKINLEIARVDKAYWSIFRKHHYLSTSLSPASACFVGFIDGRPVSFSAWLHFQHAVLKNAKIEHRTVVLPDYQGIGIGSRISEYIASMVRGIGGKPISTTSHPSMIHHRKQSALWVLKKSPTISKKDGGTKTNKPHHAEMRLTTSFEYVGPAMDSDIAKRLWESPKLPLR